MHKKCGNVQEICCSQKKFLIDWNTVHGIIFKGRTAADDVGKPSSHLPWDLVTRWSWSRGCRHFLSFVFGVDACFVFDFAVFYLWVNSDNITRSQSRHTAWFQIPYLGSCPPSIYRKISLISSAKCLASLIREPIFFQIYTGSLEFGFKLIVVVVVVVCFLLKSMRILFTDRALPTIRRMDNIWGKFSPLPYSTKITGSYEFISLSRFRPSLTGLERLRWHWVCK